MIWMGAQQIEKATTWEREKKKFVFVCYAKFYKYEPERPLKSLKHVNVPNTMWISFQYSKMVENVCSTSLEFI